MVSVNEIKNILYRDCAIVAVKTGDELQIIKDRICGLHKDDVVSIYKFFSSIKEYIHSDDHERYDYTFDTERVANMLSDDTYQCINPEFHIKAGRSKSYEPYHFNIIHDDDEVVIIIKRTDNSYNLLDNAIEFLSDIMDNIMLVNISEDSYKNIKIWNNSHRTGGFAEWYRRFVECNVVEDDHDSIINYFDDIDYSNIAYNTKPTPVVFRRCSSESQYRWTALYTIPTKNYSETNKEMYMYMIDIHEQHIAQTKKSISIGTSKYRDPETGMLNKAAYQNKITALADLEIGVSLVCIRANEHADIRSIARLITGHYGDDRSFRMSDNEFVGLVIGEYTPCTLLIDNASVGVSCAANKQEYESLYENAVEKIDKYEKCCVV